MGREVIPRRDTGMTDTGAIADRVDPASPPKPLDASMDLLNQIIRQPLDPDYALVAARGGPPTRSRGSVALVAVLIGVMFAVAALQTTRSAPALESERGELIDRVRAAEREQDRLRGRRRSCRPRSTVSARPPWAATVRH